YLTPGYYHEPEQTLAAFDADGAFRTGDLGVVREDGRVSFRGRIKELIKTGGANVAPLEVEAILMTHPAVQQAYVVGGADRGRGGDRAAPGPQRDGRGADHVLPRAAGQLQGPRAHRLPHGRRVPAHGDRQGPEAAAARGAGALVKALVCRAWGEVESLDLADV